MPQGGVRRTRSTTVTPVSVVLYVHNGGSFLSAALESILEQTHSSFELCVVDDGSTDTTPHILEAAVAGDDRIRIQRQEARGRSRLHETFNSCLAMTRHDLIAVANADDIWRSDKLERQVREFEGNADLDICHHEATFINGDGRVLFGGFRRYASPYPWTPPRPWQFVSGNPVPNPTVMFHRAILRRIGLQEVGDMHDHQFWFKATLHGCRFLGLPDRLIRYRVHEGSHSTAASRRSVILDAHRQCVADMVARYEIDQLVPELAIVAPDDTDARAWACSFIAGQLWVDASFDAAEGLWRNALRYSDNVAIMCGAAMAALRRGQESKALPILRTAADQGVGQAQALLHDPRHLEEMLPPLWHGDPPTIASLVAETDRVGLEPAVDPRPRPFDFVMVPAAGRDAGEAVRCLAVEMCGAGSARRDRKGRMIVLAASSEEVDLVTEAYSLATAEDPELVDSLDIEVDLVAMGERASIVDAHRLDGVVVLDALHATSAA